jgi:hypothetical protein
MCDHNDGFDGLDWQDIALAGALAEEMAEEEKECERLRKDLSENENDLNEDKED